MLPTPTTDHVSFDTIYEPAEDSFLLLDTLSKLTEKTWLRERFSKSMPLAVEIGTGSGVVIAFLAANAEEILGRPVLALGVDVNMNACKATHQTVMQAIEDQGSRSRYAGSVCGDLATALTVQCVDILIFNPPYVPTPDLPDLPNRREIGDAYERESHLLSLSYAGGRDGMETTDRLIAEIPAILSRTGVAYLLLCAQNKPDNVKTRIRELEDGAWQAETVGTSGKFAGWEKLQILRIWRNVV